MQLYTNYYIEITQINEVKKLSKSYSHLLLRGLSCVCNAGQHDAEWTVLDGVT